MSYTESNETLSRSGHVYREMATPDEITPLLSSSQPDQNHDQHQGFYSSSFPPPSDSMPIRFDVPPMSDAFQASRFTRLTRSLSSSTAINDDSDGDDLDKKPPTVNRRTLNTFMGVFCPIALSMFSTCLYLRGGFVVGQAGLLQSIAQLILAYLILVLTVLSICAISTNGAIEGGGAYYMISRALGPEFGGSIGALFFVANVFACALYISGFVEGVTQNFGVGGSFMESGGGMPNDSQWWTYLYASASLAFCLLICIIGGAMFARTSALILLVVVVTTLSVFISVFVKNEVISIDIPIDNKIVWQNESGSANITHKGNYTGLSLATFRENLYANYTVDYTSGNQMNFATVFAILFSSVTGIMNGANMSGELKDPSKSIPKGTLSAVAFTFTTYTIMIILISGSCTRFLLANDYVFLQKVNLAPPLVVAGIFAATLSAALGNLIGGSRVLEALANDHLFWIFLKPATMTTKSGNPYMAVLITWILVQLVLLVGSLNAIAPVTSVFFLLAYASTNLACLGLELASAPNFRPTFRYFSWYTCGLGLVGCMIMCFLISPVYTSVALVLMLALVIMLHFRSLPSTWGSISQALIFHQVRKYLLMLDPRKSHVKYWRPQILLMVANPRHSCHLMDFINDIKKSGLYVIGHVRTGQLEDFQADPVNEITPQWLKLVDHLKIKAFVEVTLAESVCQGFQHLVRLSGLGGMKPNTICLGFYDSEEPVDTLMSTKKRRRFFREVETTSYAQIESFFPSLRNGSSQRHLTDVEYVKLIADSLKMHKNVCLCRNFHLLNKKQINASATNSFIDVWPVNLFRPESASYFDNTCLFMLQLACILNMVSSWRSRTTLRVFLMVNAHKENTLQKEQKLDMFLRQLRILARVQVIAWDHLHQYMQEATLGDSEDDNGSKMQEYREMPENFVKAMNELIVNNSTRTAVSFLYLPKPPAESSSYSKYLSQLEVLTSNVQPTVFVHGLHPVTSTTL